MEPNAPAPVTAGTPKLAAALAKAQGSFRKIEKNRYVEIYSERKNTRYGFWYADLDELIDATRPALATNGLAVVQEISGDQLVTVLMHESGEERRSVLTLGNGGGDDIKTFGAKISYLRRYAYQSLLCVAADDDLDQDPNGSGDDVRTTTAKRPDVKQPQQSSTTSSPAAAPAKQDGNPGPAVSEGQLKVLKAKAAAAGISEQDLAEQFGVGEVAKIPASSCNSALDWIKQHGKSGGSK